jgi:hypothetical protein
VVVVVVVVVVGGPEIQDLPYQDDIGITENII